MFNQNVITSVWWHMQDFSNNFVLLNQSQQIHVHLPSLWSKNAHFSKSNQQPINRSLRPAFLSQDLLLLSFHHNFNLILHNLDYFYMPCILRVNKPSLTSRPGSWCTLHPQGQRLLLREGSEGPSLNWSFKHWKNWSALLKTTLHWTACWRHNRPRASKESFWAFLLPGPSCSWSEECKLKIRIHLMALKWLQWS